MLDMEMQTLTVCIHLRLLPTTQGHAREELSAVALYFELKQAAPGIGRGRGRSDRWWVGGWVGGQVGGNPDLGVGWGVGLVGGRRLVSGEVLGGRGCIVDALKCTSHVGTAPSLTRERRASKAVLTTESPAPCMCTDRASHWSGMNHIPLMSCH